MAARRQASRKRLVTFQARPQPRAPWPSRLFVALVSVLAMPIMAAMLLVVAPIGLLFVALCRLVPQRIAPEREKATICTFARSFPRRSVDTLVLRVVWEHLSDFQEVHADDRLCDDIGMEDPDLDLDLDRIAHECGRSWAGSECNPWFGKVATVRDLVHFIDAQPNAAT